MKLSAVLPPVFFCCTALSAGASDVPGENKAPAPVPEQTWQIHLDRPALAGQRFTLASTGKQDRQTKVTTPAQPAEMTTEHLEISYAAVHEVKTINKTGHPTSVLIRLDRLTTNDGSGPVEQLPAGTLISAAADGDQTRYQIGRDELDGTLADALNLAGAKLPSTREPSEDAVFLNHTPRKPGDRWSADPQRLADAIAATTTFIVDPVTSTGEIQFTQHVTENGIPALATTATFDIAPTGLRDSPDQALTQSFLKSTTLRIHPVDPALPMLKEELQTEMKLIRRARSGPQPSGSEVTFNRQVTRRYHPLMEEAKND